FSPARWEHVARVGLTTVLLTSLTWSWFGVKGLVSFFPLWVLFETIYRLRMRALIPCPHCGFDPFLYMRDVSQARAAIEEFWRGKYAAKGVPYPGDRPETEPTADGAGPKSSTTQG